MSFVCPVVGVAVGVPSWQHLVHLGLTVGVVILGAIMLMAAIVAFERSRF